MVRSRLNFFLFPLTLLIASGSGLMLFIAYAMVISNLSALAGFNFNIITVVLLLIWIAAFPLVMIIIIMRNYVTHSDKLEVRYLLGLVKNFYDYNDLIISDYYWRTKGLLIELPNGDQLTLGKYQYSNFSELKSSLEQVIRKKKLTVNYTTKFTRLFFLLGAVLLILALLSLKFLK